MTRIDLRDGNIIEWSDGNKAIVRNDLLLDITDLSTDAYISDYDINFNDLESKDEEWKIEKVYDNIVDMNLLWEREPSKIKPIGYEFNGYKLGQSIIVKGEKCNIVGFDEDCEGNFYILTTASDNKRLQFKDDIYATSTLDISDSQLVAWIREDDIVGKNTKIEENKCIVEPTPKVKIPKYVKVLKCSSDNYWYKNFVGKIFKVKDIAQTQNDYEVIDHVLGYKSACIDFKDCISISKKELLQVGSKVKLKKNIKYNNGTSLDYLNDLKSLVFTILETDTDEDAVKLLEDSQYFWWKKSMLKPVLD